MQVVCEATQCEDMDVCVEAFECLVKIMSVYYDKMPHYMNQGLFQVGSETYIFGKAISRLTHVISDHGAGHEK